MKSDFLKKAGTAFAATVAGISLLIASIYDSPKEIIENTDEDEEKNRIVLKEAKKNKRTASSLIEKLPLWFRVLVMVPLWLGGSILLKLLEPFRNLLLSILTAFVILFLIVWIVAKLLFPDLKLKDIFNKRTLIILLIASILIPLTNYVLSFTVDDYMEYVVLIDFAIGFVVLFICLFPLIQLKKKIKSIILPDEKEGLIQ